MVLKACYLTRFKDFFEDYKDEAFITFFFTSLEQPIPNRTFLGQYRCARGVKYKTFYSFDDYRIPITYGTGPLLLNFNDIRNA